MANIPFHPLMVDLRMATLGDSRELDIVFVKENAGENR
jgi:hypothetical protein